MGNKTRAALDAAGIPQDAENVMLQNLEARLKQTFPEEF